MRPLLGAVLGAGDVLPPGLRDTLLLRPLAIEEAEPDIPFLVLDVAVRDEEVDLLLREGDKLRAKPLSEFVIEPEEEPELERDEELLDELRLLAALLDEDDLRSLLANDVGAMIVMITKAVRSLNMVLFANCFIIISSIYIPGENLYYHRNNVIILTSLL